MLLPAYGNVTVNLGAGDSIAVYSQGYVDVSRLVGFPNYPDRVSVIGQVNNGQVVFGPFASGASILLEASGGVEVHYETGASPVVKQDRRDATAQVTVNAVNTTATLTAAQLLAGIITSTTAAAVTGTLPTGTLIDSASDFSIDDAFDWVVINTGATNAFTVAAGTGHTIVGSGTVALSSAATFRTRKTAANTFVTYRT
jgi:hypothetical protein